MTTQDVFYLSVSAAASLFAGFGAYAFYHIAHAAKKIKNVAEDVENTTADIVSVKEELKLGTIAFLKALLGLTSKTLERR